MAIPAGPSSVAIQYISEHSDIVTSVKTEDREAEFILERIYESALQKLVYQFNVFSHPNRIATGLETATFVSATPESATVCSNDPPQT